MILSKNVYMYIICWGIRICVSVTTGESGAVRLFVLVYKYVYIQMVVCSTVDGKIKFLDSKCDFNYFDHEFGVAIYAKILSGCVLRSRRFKTKSEQMQLSGDCNYVKISALWSAKMPANVSPYHSYMYFNYGLISY